MWSCHFLAGAGSIDTQQEFQIFVSPYRELDKDTGSIKKGYTFQGENRQNQRESSVAQTVHCLER